MRKILCILLVLNLLLGLSACQAELAPSDSNGTSHRVTTSENASKPTGSTTESTAPSTDTCDHQMECVASKESTCTEGGYQEYKCSLCGQRMSSDLAPLEHKLSDATCTTPKTCTVCFTTDGPPLGHSYVDGKCTRCDYEAPDGLLTCKHSYEITQQTAPTCTQAGSTTFTCTGCGTSYPQTSDPTGHTYVAATCSTPKVCSICAHTDGEALGHDYGDDGLCIRCSAESPKKPAKPENFTVTVRNKKGSTIAQVMVTVFVDGVEAGSGVTDDKGKAVISVIPGSSYTVKLIVPSGYIGKESYTFTTLSNNITLSDAPVLNPNDHSAAQYRVGSTMADFTLTDVDGVTYNLYTLLQEKNAVILNFWFVNCGPCKAEFPYFDEAYQLYGEEVQLLALSHFDSEADILALRNFMGITFPMISENIGMQQGFGIQAYPTTVVIGKDGTIQMIHSGSYNREQVMNLFATYA